MNDDREFNKALFRFSLISQLIHCNDEIQKQEIMREIAAKEIDMPHSIKKGLTVKTIKNYLARYLRSGFDGLKRKSRRDRNTVKSVSDDVIHLLKTLKREKPERSSSQVIRLVNSREEYRSLRLSERTVSRILKKSGLTRKNLAPKRIHRGFEMETINDLWETDISDGIFLTREKQKTYCFAFLDDYSRLIPHAQFYTDEKLPRLEDCLKKAILKRGIPKAIYADNGKVFTSAHFRRICAELGIRLLHHLPYSPQSKGKIERFFLRMKQEFLIEAKSADIQSIEELNSHFQSWLEVEYHRREHAGIGSTPLDRFIRALAQTKLRSVESMENITEIFLYREKRKVHKKSGIIRLSGNEYQLTDASLLDCEIEARFDPFDMSRVFVYRDGKFVQIALPLNLKSREYPLIPEEKEDDEKIIKQSSIDFFTRLKVKEQELLRSELRHIDFTKIKKEI
ncbi:MAG: DDE-type integrase/transposase/recombinase [Candidatus Aminicenantes bacterium]|nr:DDE-type integrase/transposase/recombinase [Candidatus Aminicenantes bacterium]